MHVHKMFKKMHKKHGGLPPPPGMFHGMPGMGNHMMPKTHEMWPHMHPKMGHHKMHPHKFHKMLHKMHKKHYKKHHGQHSSSSSSSESEDESLVDGVEKVQITDKQQGKESNGNETPAPPCDGGDNEKFKCKRGKHFKSKDKKEKCKYCRKEAFSPYWMQFNSMRGPSCRDSSYEKGKFCPPPPGWKFCPVMEEGRAATEQNAPQEATPHVNFEEVTGHGKSKISGQHSVKRVQRRGDSVDYFMQSIAEQIKKLPEAKIAEAKLKILEVVNEMQPDLAPGQPISPVGMNIENEQPLEPQPENQSIS